MLRLKFDYAEGLARSRASLAGRKENFLSLLREAVFGHAASPYRQLLEAAGCEYGDVERLVSDEGLEGALHVLLRAGVYLNFDELRGTCPARRGSTSIDVGLDRLANPRVALLLQHAARGRTTAFRLDSASRLDRILANGMQKAPFGFPDMAWAFWKGPGSGELSTLMDSSVHGTLPERWFSPVDPAAPAVDRRYRWSALALGSIGLLMGKRFPLPEYAPADRCEPVLEWIDQKIRQGRTPAIRAYPSAAVRLAETAASLGRSLDGLWLELSGEPLTPARGALLRDMGARVIVNYSAHESGPIAKGCLYPVECDEGHVLTDVQAVIQPGIEGEPFDLRPDAILLSSLLPGAPFILMNASIGDEAVLTARDCGCPLQQLGTTTHIHTIRSFEKLTVGGMTFADSDVVKVLEEVLPASFGGGPTSFQLLEDDRDGRASLRLLVEPAIGPIDEGRVKTVFIESLSRSSATGAIMGEAWRDGGYLSIERRSPIISDAGKILHLLNNGRVARSDRA